MIAIFQMVKTPQLSQVAHKQPAQLPDGTPGIRLQIPYLEEFFGTMWYPDPQKYVQVVCYL